MVYIPNPTDASQPTGNVDASTADDEFRALKAYVLGLALTAGMFMPVRQCANDGFVNSSGDPAFLTAAAAGGLALDLKATGRPLVANFAGGSTGTGINDRNGTYTGDTANVITGLAGNCTNFIYADYVSQSAWTWGSTLAQPQYGKTYDFTRQSVLQFAGAAGSTTFLDDFGNTWTAQGGAKVQTNQFKFGTGGLGGAGASNALNGAADYLKTAAGAITLNSLGGWSIRAWARTTSLALAPGTINCVIAMANAGTFGALLGIVNTGGTIRFGYYLSSTGAAHDIANGVQGTTLPVINTDYFLELTFDPLGAGGTGTYRLYVNGVQEASNNSALRVHNSLLVSSIGAIGTGAAGTYFFGYIDKPEILPYCQHPAGTAYAVPTAAPAIGAAGYAPDFFDIQAMKMYSVASASAVAGTGPTLTANKYRCYFGEADCSGVVPTAVRNYAFNGKYTSPDTAIVALGTRTPFQANIGTRLVITDIKVRNVLSEAGYFPGSIATIDQGNATYAFAYNPGIEDERGLVLSWTSGVNSIGVVHRTTGVVTGITGANWRYVVTAQRMF